MVNNKLSLGKQRIQTFLATAEDVNINKYLLDVITKKVPQKQSDISIQFLYDVIIFRQMNIHVSYTNCQTILSDTYSTMLLNIPDLYNKPLNSNSTFNQLFRQMMQTNDFPNETTHGKLDLNFCSSRWRFD